MLKKVMSAILAVLFVGSLAVTAACNTVHGIGQDVERGGEKLQQEANEHK